MKYLVALGCLVAFGCSDVSDATSRFTESTPKTKIETCSASELAAQLGLLPATTFEGVLMSVDPGFCEGVTSEAGQQWCTQRGQDAGIEQLVYVPAAHKKHSECGCACPPEPPTPDPFPTRACADELGAQFQAAQDVLGDQYEFLDSGVIAWECSPERSAPCDALEMQLDFDLDYVEWSDNGTIYCGCVCEECADPPEPKLDIVFVVDDSGSMAGEQTALTRSVHDLIQGLMTGDVDGDGSQDFPPIVDLHAGVVTTNMPVGPSSWMPPQVNCTVLGDDGILQSNGAVTNVQELGGLCATTSCDCDPPTPSNTPSYVALASPTEAEVNAATVELACTVRQGTTGCNYEQPLEAMLKAVTPAAGLYPDGTPDFMYGVGHQDGANAGLLRDDAFLLIVLLTDEDDCSGQLELFQTAPESHSDMVVRCFQDSPLNFLGEFLWPTTRYSDGLLQLRDHSRLGFLAIAGVPQGVDGVDFPSLLTHPAMQQLGADDTPDACGSGNGSAKPSRRIVTTAQALADAGAYAEVASVCDNNYDDVARNARVAVGEALTCEEPALCPPGYSTCGGVCANLEIDAANCGACGNACMNGCSGGLCSSFD